MRLPVGRNQSYPESVKRPSVLKTHRHVGVTTYRLHSLAGVPYEVERTVCQACGQVLAERPLRRAAA